MQTYENALGRERTRNKGTEEINGICEGLGFMDCQNLDKEVYTHKKFERAVNLVSAEKSSDSHYDFTFEFKYEFSTSTNPRVAGIPSDVIVGGGLDIIVTDVIQGK
jgi:hypothetical protein